MKEIVVLSGKGGTGKTSLTAAWAVLGGADLVLADCDVDAADLHLLLQPDFAHAEAFHAGELASIEPDACGGCGRCREVCRFGAITVTDGVHAVDPLACEGCGYCARVCPDGAVINRVRRVGECYRSTTRTGAVMAHARLDIGAENSGKLVARVKRDARSAAAAAGRPLVLVDGSPGVGCPVVSSLTGASLAVLVTEPTRSGLHDLERVLALVRSFDIPAVCILNKADLNDEVRGELRAFLDSAGVPMLVEIPYCAAFSAAITAGETIVDRDTGLRPLVARAWAEIRRIADAGSNTGVAP